MMHLLIYCVVKLTSATVLHTTEAELEGAKKYLELNTRH